MVGVVLKRRQGLCGVADKYRDAIYILTNDSPTGIEESQVKKIELIKTQNKTKLRLTAPCVYDDWGSAQWEIGVNDFGKTAFLTRKEAERVLKRSVKQWLNG